MKLGSLKVLHPYVDLRGIDQVETWSALDLIRSKYQVVDRCLKTEHGYDDFLAEHWGSDDLTIIEMDVVVHLRHVESMAACPKLMCMFGYQIPDGPHMPIVGVLYAFGCCKIMKALQECVPVSGWHRQGTWTSLDSRIKAAILKTECQPHEHKGEVLKHNHPGLP